MHLKLNLGAEYWEKVHVLVQALIIYQNIPKSLAFFIKQVYKTATKTENVNRLDVYGTQWRQNIAGCHIKI